MKQIYKYIRIIWLGFAFLFIQLSLNAQESELYNQIKSFPEVKSIQKISNYPFFKETYEILIDQYLNHENPSEGKFTQRVILSDYNKYSPIIFVTEGYSADYALKPNYINELSKILEGNQIIVEHRYFGKSMPNNPNWDYLTVKNACADLHRIQKIFSRLYNNQNKWIATGASKGGYTTLAYKALYPNDAQIWIAYVAPLNFSTEDKRIDVFLDNVGSQLCRDKIDEFQRDVLSKRDSIQPMLDSLIKSQNLTFRITNEEVLDYWLMEYELSFWQYGSKCSEIPGKNISIKKKFDYLLKVRNPEYFSIEGIVPTKSYYVQAAKELGHHGYNVKPLKGFLKIQDTKGYLSKIFLPDNVTFKFDKSTNKYIEKSIQNDGKHIMLIYGEFDPWTGTAVNIKSSNKASKIIIPGASHNIKIASMPYKQKAEIYMILETWLNED